MPDNVNGCPTCGLRLPSIARGEGCPACDFVIPYSFRYDEAPAMHVAFSCDGAECGFNTVHHDGDSFICSDCGTSWPDTDDDGTLYADWSGVDTDHLPVKES